MYRLILGILGILRYLQTNQRSDKKGEMSELGYEFKRLQSLPHSQGRISLIELLKQRKKAATYTFHYQLASPKSVAAFLEQTQLGKN